MVPGDRVAIMSYNSSEGFELATGCGGGVVWCR